MAYFTAIEEVLAYQKTLLSNAATLSEFKHVGHADDEMFFAYPALVISAEPTVTELHATHQFKNYFRTAIFIYHGEMTDDRSVRTKDDIALATKVRTVLHSDFQMGGGVIFGFVDNIVPGTIRRPGNVFAIGTRLSWRGEAKEAFQ